MKVIILAAGLGSRLKTITKNKPKCLVTVGGMPLIERTLNNFLRNGLKQNEISIVVGYRSQILKKYLKKYPEVIIVTNKDYAKTDNVYSLYLALKQIYLKKNEALIIANGDCIYEQQFIKEFLKSKRIDVIVSDRRIYKNDLMKIKLKNGCVEKISKNMDLKFADSTSTSMFKISHKTMLRLMKVLQKYVKENRLKCWFEDAMAQIFPSVRFGLFDIEGKKWIEVDCLKDLQEARTLFKKTDRRQRCES